MYSTNLFYSHCKNLHVTRSSCEIRTAYCMCEIPMTMMIIYYADFCILDEFIFHNHTHNLADAMVCADLGGLTCFSTLTKINQQLCWISSDYYCVSDWGVLTSILTGFVVYTGRVRHNTMYQGNVAVKCLSGLCVICWGGLIDSHLLCGFDEVWSIYFRSQEKMITFIHRTRY